MAVKVKLPKMSDTMEEGVIVSWQVKVGDKVQPGDILAEVETDKATMDLENYEKGTVLHLAIEEGSAVPVDGTIAIIGEKGEDFEALLKEEDAPKAEEPETEEAEAEESAKAEEAVASPANQSSAQSTTTTTEEGRIKASPLAKKMAEEKGISLELVAGSGEGGRIIKRDIENYTPSAQAQSSTAVGVESFEEVPVSQMRKTIARRLSESKFSAPHFYLTMEIRMDKAVAARKAMNEISEHKISMNDLIVKAVAQSLKQHPQVNASWLGDKIRYNHHIHVGVAMAVDEGLLVPVVKFTNQKSLSQISQEVKDFSEKAKAKKLQPTDWEGNTFTVSNLGMFGIEEFTAIINPPDACILAVGGVKDVPVVENGQIVPGKTMKVTLSCDHRVVDGVVGSRFLQTLKGLLEEPVAMLV